MLQWYYIFSNCSVILKNPWFIEMATKSLSMALAEKKLEDINNQTGVGVI